MTQRDDLEPIDGLGIAAAEGGSVKSWRLGQIYVGANTHETQLKGKLCHKQLFLKLYSVPTQELT